MSDINTLEELYVDELKDLWSANDQMSRALTKILPHAADDELQTMLRNAQDGIATHTSLLQQLIEARGAEVRKEHCKGMEGLVAEAIKHTVEDAPQNSAVRDAAIIAQFQRMTHYGITGFGTVAAFAEALELDDDADQLRSAVADMYDADELMSDLATSAVNDEAADVT